MPHFSADEFDNRVASAQQLLRARDLDGILLFAPESQYYLTGYDTFGFAMFQCVVLAANAPVAESLHLLTRAPDMRQALHTSTFSADCIHLWVDEEGVDPARELARLLAELNLAGESVLLGVETQTVGLTAWNWQQLAPRLQGVATLVEASDLIRSQRRVKSAAEIDCHRRAAAQSDAALDAALGITSAGAFEGDILAAMQGAVFQDGGDYAGNEFIIGSGTGALMCRYFSGRRHLDSSDQLTLEWSGAWRRYHAAMMRTLVVGNPPERQLHMHTATVSALEACEAAIKPGVAMGDVFDVHARVLDQHGYSHARMNACGYGMGAVYNPIWVDFPMFYAGNPQLIEVGNVFFLHMILMDSSTSLAMCWGHSVLVTETGIERLSRHSMALPEC